MEVPTLLQSTEAFDTAAAKYMSIKAKVEMQHRILSGEKVPPVSALTWNENETTLELAKATVELAAKAYFAAIKEAIAEPSAEVGETEGAKAGASEIDWNKPLEMTCPRPERWCPATRLYVRDKATQGFQRQYCNLVAPGAGGSDLEDSRSMWVNAKGRQFGGGNFLYVRNKKAQ